MDGPSVPCSCEGVAHGELGAVLDDERVVRIVTSPRHVKNGRLKPGAFPLSHIEKSGLSVVRREHLTDDQLKVLAAEIAGRSDAEVPYGTLIGSAAQIRSVINTEGERSLCLFDDPVVNDGTLSDNPAHALVIKSGCSDDTLRLQGQLLEIFDTVQRFE